MLRFIIRRLLQAIPLLFIISIILFVLMNNVGDPLATMGGRNVTRAEDRARLSRQLGLDKPIYMQYIYWLIGNDWTKVDLDGDGVAETPGTPLRRAARRLRPVHRRAPAGDGSHQGSAAQHADPDDRRRGRHHSWRARSSALIQRFTNIPG